MKRLIFAGWLVAGLGQAAAIPVVVGAAGGFELPGVLELPDGVNPGRVGRVVVLIHGSGPHDMDENLTASCRPGERNLFFKDLSSALRRRGFAVLRYDKRAFVAAGRLNADPAFASSSVFTAYAADPLGAFIADAASAAGEAAHRCPRSRIILLGHSEGCMVALAAARLSRSIAGVGLIGCLTTSIDTAIYEQTVWRPRKSVERLDRDTDGMLTDSELSEGGEIGRALLAQKRVLDLDRDGRISVSEILAGNLSNIVLDGPSAPEYRIGESRWPRVGDLIARAGYPIAIFQGEFDNQTPPFHARAIELLNHEVWKRSNLRFRYFPGLGHALDPRDDPDDLLYRTSDPAALAMVAADLDGLFR